MHFNIMDWYYNRERRKGDLNNPRWSLNHPVQVLLVRSRRKEIEEEIDFKETGIFPKREILILCLKDLRNAWVIFTQNCTSSHCPTCLSLPNAQGTPDTKGSLLSPAYCVVFRTSGGVCLGGGWIWTWLNSELVGKVCVQEADVGAAVPLCLQECLFLKRQPENQSSPFNSSPSTWLNQDALPLPQGSGLSCSALTLFFNWENLKKSEMEVWSPCLSPQNYRRDIRR